MQSDQQFLAAYLKGDEAAFAEIVERYLPLVIAAARRQSGPDDAEDIAQVVFALAARKANTLAKHASIAGWLHTVTRYTAINLRKMGGRQIRRERAGAKPEVAPTAPPEASWEQIAPTLDEALASLSHADREALLLRYFQGASMEDIAQTLAVSPETARKRLSRAVDRLRCFFSSHGANISPAALPLLLSQHGTEPVPPHVSQQILTQMHLLSPTQIALSKGVTSMIFWTKAKLAAVLAAFFLTAAVGGVAVVSYSHAAPVPSVPAAPAAPTIAGPRTDEFPEIAKGRLVEHLYLPLQATALTPKQRTIYEGSAFTIDWTAPQNLQGSAGFASIVVVPLTDKDIAALPDPFDSNNPAVHALINNNQRAAWFATGIPPTASAWSYGDNNALLTGAGSKSPATLTPGTYLVYVGLFDQKAPLQGGKQEIARNCAVLTVAPQLMTQAGTSEIGTDGIINFESLQSQINFQGEITTGGFMNSDFVEVTDMLDADGQPILFTSDHDMRRKIYRYRYTLNKPVAAGDSFSITTRGTETSLVHINNNTGVYAMNHSPGGSVPVHRVELFTLPKGATLTDVIPTDAKCRTIDGVQQIYIDKTIPVGGSIAVRIRFKLPG